jgi:AAA domain-containing protein
VLDGDPGMGKSTVALTITAKVSTGSPFPDGTRPDPAEVIVLSAEDEIGDTIRPRLEAAGADVNRVWVLPDVREEDKKPRPPELPLDLDRLEAMVKDRGAALVVIDPLMAFLSGAIDAHRDQDVRRVLASITYMAARTGAAVLIIRHMNKSGGTNPLYRGGGSIGIVGAARSGMLAAPDPDDDSRRILAVTKANLAKEPPALAYRLIEDERYGVARITWDGATSHKAADLLRLPAREGQDDAPARHEAQAILAEILAEGPLPARTVKALAGEAGVSERTLARAREALGVTTQREGFGKGARYVWALPDPSCVPPQPPMDAMDAKVASSQDPGTHGTHVGQVASMDADPMPLFDADNPGDPARFTR